MYKKLLCISLFSFLLCGCFDKSPLQKMQSDILYADMNNVFWGKEQEKKSALWKEASTYCIAHNEKPNCGPLLLVFVITNGATEMPDPKNAGPGLRVPDFK